MKTLPIVILSLFCQYARGQMSGIVKNQPAHTVGKVVNIATFIGELDYDITADDTVYSLVYRNYEYSRIDDRQVITFSGKGHTVDSLYTAMSSVFLPENKKNKDYILQFTLGQTPVTVAPFRVMGSTVCSLHRGNSYALFTERQLDKLFGKR